MAGSSKSVRGRAPFGRRCGARCVIAIADAASRAVGYGSARVITSAESPPLPAVPSDPVGMLRARHDERGLDVHARTSMPGWLGERLDVGWAIDVLHPLAATHGGGTPASRAQ